MIVKTGANYQENGGYIEASLDGVSVIIKTDSREIKVPNANVLVDSLVPCMISKDESITQTITLNGVQLTPYIRTGGFVIQSQPRELGIFYKVGAVISVSDNSSIKLGEGSIDCMLKNQGGFYELIATGASPVAILEVA